MRNTEMRVAMLAPIAWRTPPRTYGPWELVTSMLTEALVQRGVEGVRRAQIDTDQHGARHVTVGASPRRCVTQ